jgi:hypothetical protein
VLSLGSQNELVMHKDESGFKKNSGDMEYAPDVKQRAVADRAERPAVTSRHFAAGAKSFESILDLVV